ncbi:MAG: hypothetical protein OEU86_06610 [Gammaproteobacteria bacterium]|nr:hypothetical protein [Gammaproteobacteria bacterium]
MTHRVPDRRWIDNPDHRVGSAQLNHVQDAEKRVAQTEEQTPQQASQSDQHSDPRIQN